MAQFGNRTPAPLEPPKLLEPRVVAHRGNATDFPENTLPAFASALDAGLSWVEMDVQLSADGLPFVIHDAELDRTTRSTGDIRLMHSAELATVDAGEPHRFGDAHRATALPRLSDFAGLLGRYPGAGAFVELKRESIARHGREACVERTVEALGAVAGRCVAISFDEGAIEIARQSTGMRIGWVIEWFSRAQLDLLQALRPEFVFYNYLKCLGPPEATLPAGPWRWVAYEVEDDARARAEFARGAAMVESMAPLRVAAGLASPAARP
jgi:glycerophosphoryl diester phosphodiesterase